MAERVFEVDLKPVVCSMDSKQIYSGCDQIFKDSTGRDDASRYRVDKITRLC